MSCDISKFICTAKYTQSFSSSSTVAVVVSIISPSSFALGFNFNEQNPLITSSKVLDLISVTTGKQWLGSPKLSSPEVECSRIGAPVGLAVVVFKASSLSYSIS